MRVLAAVKTVFDATVSPRAFFADATVAGLALSLVGGDAVRGTSGGARDGRNPRESPIRRHPRSAGSAHLRVGRDLK
jgi:hypothetical protein